MEYISKESIEAFRRSLIENERSANTIEKYLRDVRVFAGFICGKGLDKAVLVGYKSALEQDYSPASVNSMLAAVNCYLDFIGRADLRVKPLKIQKQIFSTEEKELGREEYERLVRAAKSGGNERLMLIVETICSTGIRVSELKFITVEAVGRGFAEIKCKGKHRVVLLPEKLREVLKAYSARKNISAGAIFITRSGKPVDRSNIWRDMKNLCESAVVPKKKVFPHNLRHLFAKTFYSVEKDLIRLADLLGHSSINTTRIYTAQSSREHARLLEKMNLMVFTT